ncbi:MAG TPA: histidine kinase [Microbacterium sp.]|uniref:histidine kinase n=1 Tax=Microbacterium sp. TaxID=51671 RepID=UPI002C6087DB|nr:histidine kinase [Microbacterium sp.]HWI31317.1 histidine kinase [Microbacterium sp.]
MRTNAPSVVAAIIIALEGLGLLALAGWQLVALVSGDVDSAPSALALLVLTLVGAAAVVAFAIAVARRRSWGRSGAIVTQVLILAVALGAVTGAYAHPLLAAALAAPAVAALAFLIAAARRAAAEEGRPDAS